jgi:hypothetical protein
MTRRLAATTLEATMAGIPSLAMRPNRYQGAQVDMTSSAAEPRLDWASGQLRGTADAVVGASGRVPKE